MDRCVAVGSGRGQGRDARAPPPPGSRVRPCRGARRHCTPPGSCTGAEGRRRPRLGARRAECRSRLLRAVARGRPVAGDDPYLALRIGRALLLVEGRGRGGTRACVGRAGGIRSCHGCCRRASPRRGHLAARGTRPRLRALRASPGARPGPSRLAGEADRRQPGRPFPHPGRAVARGSRARRAGDRDGRGARRPASGSATRSTPAVWRAATSATPSGQATWSGASRSRSSSSPRGLYAPTSTSARPSPTRPATWSGPTP